MLVYVKNVLRYRKLGHILDLLTFIQRNVLLGKIHPVRKDLLGFVRPIETPLKMACHYYRCM